MERSTNLVGRGSGITHAFEQSRSLSWTAGALGLAIAEPPSVLPSARNGSATVGRRPRRAHDVYLSRKVERAGFEPRCGTVVAQDTREFDVPFVPIVGEFHTSSRGSNPARLAISSWRDRGRAETRRRYALAWPSPASCHALRLAATKALRSRVFALPILGPRSRAQTTFHFSPFTFHLSHSPA